MEFIVDAVQEKEQEFVAGEITADGNATTQESSAYQVYLIKEFRGKYLSSGQSASSRSNFIRVRQGNGNYLDYVFDRLIRCNWGISGIIGGFCRCRRDILKEASEVAQPHLSSSPS